VARPDFKTYIGTFRTDGAGQIILTGILNVEAYNKVNVLIIQSSQSPVNIAASCLMGKLSGQTVSQVIARFPVDVEPKIQTFEVIGPEFSMTLVGGPPDTDVSIQAWVFIH
jgi:hypothetical protein